MKKKHLTIKVNAQIKNISLKVLSFYIIFMECSIMGLVENLHLLKQDVLVQLRIAT